MSRTIRWTIVALLAPTLLFAQFGDWAIIANQVRQIGHAITMVRHLGSTASDLTNQLTHLKEEALGKVGALPDSIQQLAADPTTLLDTTVPWATDVESLEALELVHTLTTWGEAGPGLSDHWRSTLGEADTIGESEIMALFDNPQAGLLAAEQWKASRDHSEAAIVQDFATFDAAEQLFERLTDALEAVNTLRGQTNLSGTALTQAQLAGQITDSEVRIATAQMQAMTAIRDALARQQAVAQRRRELAQWVAAEEDWLARKATIQADVMARSDNTRRALRLVRE